MDVKDRVFQEPPAIVQWFQDRGWRVLPAIAFLVVHVAGGTFAVLAIAGAWRFRLMMQILTDRSLFFKLFHFPWFTVLVGLAAVVVVAAVEVFRALRRWKNEQPEPNIALRLRALLVAAIGCLIINAFYWSSPAAF